MLQLEMTDQDRFPAIDDPGMPGGQLPQPRGVPAGRTAGNAGGADEPRAADLDLPGPDDPVAWRYVKPGTPVHGPGGEQLGTVDEMLGSYREDIFHGVAVKTRMFGASRVVRADDVVLLTPARVEVTIDAAALAAAAEHQPHSRAREPSS